MLQVITQYCAHPRFHTTCLSVSVCLPVCLFLSVSVCLSICLSVCLSVTCFSQSVSQSVSVITFSVLMTEITESTKHIFQFPSRKLQNSSISNFNLQARKSQNLDARVQRNAQCDHLRCSECRTLQNMQNYWHYRKCRF